MWQPVRGKLGGKKPERAIEGNQLPQIYHNRYCKKVNISREVGGGGGEVAYGGERIMMQ